MHLTVGYPATPTGDDGAAPNLSLGSTAARILASTDAPVIVVPRDWDNS